MKEDYPKLLRNYLHTSFSQHFILQRDRLQTILSNMDGVDIYALDANERESMILNLQENSTDSADSYKLISGTTFLQ